MIIKVGGGLEPLGPIGVYAYGPSRSPPGALLKCDSEYARAYGGEKAYSYGHASVTVPRTGWHCDRCAA